MGQHRRAAHFVNAADGVIIIPIVLFPVKARIRAAGKNAYHMEGLIWHVQEIIFNAAHDQHLAPAGFRADFPMIGHHQEVVAQGRINIQRLVKALAAVAVLGVRMGIAAIDRFIGIYQNHFFRLISNRFCMAASRGRLYR